MASVFLDMKSPCPKPDMPDFKQGDFSRKFKLSGMILARLSVDDLTRTLAKEIVNDFREILCQQVFLKTSSLYKFSLLIYN